MKNQMRLRVKRIIKMFVTLGICIAFTRIFHRRHKTGHLRQKLAGMVPISKLVKSIRARRFFKCPSTFCIPVYAICNGKIDCPNGKDEEHCQKIFCPGFLLCRDDRLCVHPHDVWSGPVKCPISMDDKALHGTGTCPDLCECLGNSMQCTKAAKLNLPKLPATIRMLTISNTQFAMDKLQ